MRLFSVLLIALATQAQDKIGPISGMRLPVWDWTQPGESKYIFLKLDPATLAIRKAADGLTWELYALAAPGTNPTAEAPLYLFNAADFDITPEPEGTAVSVRWPLFSPKLLRFRDAWTAEILGTNTADVTLDGSIVLKDLGPQPPPAGSDCTAGAGVHIAASGFYLCAPPASGSGASIWRRISYQ